MSYPKRHAAALAALIVAATVAAIGPGQTVAEERSDAPQQLTVPGELVVGFDSGVTKRQERSAVSGAGAAIEQRVDSIDGALITAHDPGQIDDVAKRLAQREIVRFVEPNYVVRAAKLPNDPGFGGQWGLRDVEAIPAWDATTGGPVTVAVVDTGVDYDHPDLVSNAWHNEAEHEDGMDEDGDGFADDVHGADFLNQDPDPRDDDGHGTHVGGIIGAQGNNSIGITGVSWDVNIMALKFLDSSGNGNTADAALAIDYAVDHGARVINASWSGPQFSQALYSAVERAGARGALFVAAAGNEKVNADVTPQYPASFDLPNVISVAASDRHDRLLDFSSYGRKSIDLAAPGEEIQSTVPSRVSSSGYAAFSGTSMATPFVSGAAALYISRFPAATPTEVRNAILGSVARRPTLTRTTVSGGRLDIAAMLGRQSPSGRLQKDAIAPSPFTLLRPANRRARKGRSLRFRWQRARDASGIREYKLYVDGRRVRTVRDHDGPGGRDPRPRISIRLHGGRHRWFVRALDYAGNARRSHSYHNHRSVKSSLLFVASLATRNRRVLLGTGGKDTIRGTVAGNKLYGGRSADRLFGYAGNDLIRGGTGRDTLAGGSGDDLLYGDEAADLMYGQEGADQLFGATAPDAISGGPGDDKLFGDSGDDHVSGGEGNDSLDGGFGRDRLRGDGGDDTMSAGAAGDELHGGAGNDRLDGGSAEDTLFGDDGDDYLTGGTARDQIYGGAGNDVINAVEPVGVLSEGVIDCGPGVDTVYVDRRDQRATRFSNCETIAPGTAPADGDPSRGVKRIGGAGAQTLLGADLDDTLLGGAGNDVLRGFAGDDDLWGDHVPGSTGNDRIYAGAGNDQVFGNSGRDVLVGDEGDDRISGGPGSDSIDGGPGNDEIRPDGGADHVLAGPGNDSVHAFGGGKRDVVDCGPGHDTAFVDMRDRTRNCESVTHR